MIVTGVGGMFGIGFLGTGIGSFINGTITMTNGGSYHAGWAGGQISGIISLIPYLGSAMGAFVGSILTDFIDSNYNFSKIDLVKASISAGIGFVLSWFGNTISWSKESLSKITQLVLSYDYALISSINSIINVYWRKKNI